MLLHGTDYQATVDDEDTTFPFLSSSVITTTLEDDVEEPVPLARLKRGRNTVLVFKIYKNAYIYRAS